MDISLNDFVKTPKRLFIFSLGCLISVQIINAVVWAFIYLTGIKSVDALSGLVMARTGQWDLITWVMYAIVAGINFAVIFWTGKKIALFKKDNKYKGKFLLIFEALQFVFVFLLAFGIVGVLFYWFEVYKLKN